MKKTATDSDVLFLPEEIIRNIFKRLPVKSLIRFQCVCKDWKNLIQNPSFIEDHLEQSSHQNPSLLLECNGRSIPVRWRLTVLDSALQVRGVPNSPSTNSLRDASVVGSCNGVFCLEIHHFDRHPYLLALWNPATTAVRHVPRAIDDLSNFVGSVTGFGFSPIGNDYKIVRTYSTSYDVVSLAEVFSLREGTWKGVDVGNLKGVMLSSETVTVNGAIFWYGEKQDDAGENGEFEEIEEYIEEDKVIVSFDMEKEVFTVIPKPDFDDDDSDEKLTVYDNKVALLCDMVGDAGTRDWIDLWVLDEGRCASGETWSWTKRYTICPNLCRLDSMAIWRDEIVCKPYSEEDEDKGRRNSLYMINPTTNEVKRFVIPYCGKIISIYNYVESLVSIGNYYIEES